MFSAALLHLVAMVTVGSMQKLRRNDTYMWIRKAKTNQDMSWRRGRIFRMPGINGEFQCLQSRSLSILGWLVDVGTVLQNMRNRKFSEKFIKYAVSPIPSRSYNRKKIWLECQMLPCGYECGYQVHFHGDMPSVNLFLEIDYHTTVALKILQQNNIFKDLCCALTRWSKT